MKKNEYLIMLFQDNETEADAKKKELHEAVLECTVEALSQTADDVEINSAIGLSELFNVILESGKSSKAQCVSPFKASELIAEKLGVKYTRPLDRMRAQFGQPAEVPIKRLEDFL